MKVHKSLILASLLVVLGIVQGQAQQAGYLGKRLLAGYQLGFAIDYSVGINLKHTVHADYIVSKKNMIGGEISFMSMPILFRENQFYKNHPQFDATASFTQVGAVFTFHGFGSQALAPLGDFFQLKAMVANVTGTDPIGYSVDKWWELDEVKPYEDKMRLFGIGLVYGHSKMIYDRVLLTASADFNLYLPAGSIPTGPNQIAIEAASKVFYANMLSFRIGAAGLLF